MLKTRSVDVRKEPGEVFRDTADALEDRRAGDHRIRLACPVPPGPCRHRLQKNPHRGIRVTDGIRLYSGGALPFIAILLLIGLVMVVIPLLFLGLVGAAFTRLRVLLDCSARGSPADAVREFYRYTPLYGSAGDGPGRARGVIL